MKHLMSKQIKKIAAFCLLAILSLVCVTFATSCFADDNVPIERMKSSVGLVIVVADILNSQTGEVIEAYPLGTGSCFMVGNGDFAVTNCHVTDAETTVSELMHKYPINISNVKLAVIFYDKSGRKIGLFPVKVIDENARKDLALITLPPEIRNAGVEPVKFLHDNQIKVGMDAWAVGFPLAAYGDKAMIKDHTVTKGIVSKFNAECDGRYCVQTTAAINGGNSGGALYDERGNIIGVNTFIMDHSFAEGLNFAVQCNEIVTFLEANKVPVVYADDVNGNATSPQAEMQEAPSEGTPTEATTPQETQTTAGDNTADQYVWIILVVASVLLVVCLGVYFARSKNYSREKQNLPTPQGRMGNAQRVPGGRDRVADGVFTLTGVKGSFSGMNIPFHSFPASLGRDTSVCKVQFAPNTKGVSRLHCTISHSAGVFSVTDFSSYGTFINGQKLAPNQPTKLHNGDMLACAGEVFKVIIR